HHDLFDRRDAVPRGLERAMAARAAQVHLVLREARRAGVLLHLGALDAAAVPLRPAHELGVEGAAVRVARARDAHRRARLSTGRPVSPALLVGFSAVPLASALMVVLHRNPVSSALFLVVAFCALAGIYILLRAEFIGMVQVIVYAGAIMVLFLFVCMFLNPPHALHRAAF